MPKSVKDVHKFLGLANYYRRFVKDFAKIVRLLYEMIRKDISGVGERGSRKHLRN